MRNKSVSRQAFAAAADGAQAEIAVDCFPTVGYGTAQSKLSRVLGPDGDMNPPWTVLDRVLARDAGTVITWLCQEYGYEPPKKLADDPMRVLERIERRVSAHAEELADLLEEARSIRDRIGPVRAGTLREKDVA